MEFPWGSPIPRGEDFGIIAEPYFDVDFKEVLYLTDTGRRWDGDEVSVRDKVENRGQRSEVGRQRTEQRDGWINRMGSPAGTDGRRKTPRLNTLDGDPSEMRCARHGHEFHGVKMIRMDAPMKCARPVE